MSKRKTWLEMSADEPVSGGSNYYFTESKWYGPLPDIIEYTFFDIDYLYIPSGPSLIPQFAGMVKEEGKDFKFKLEQTIFVDQQQWQEMSRSEKDECFTKTAVPIQTAVSVAEEGEQTFSAEDMIGFLDWAKEWFTPIEGTEIWMASAKTYIKGNPPDLSEYITADLFLQYTEYLKTKQ